MSFGYRADAAWDLAQELSIKNEVLLRIRPYLTESFMAEHDTDIRDLCSYNLAEATWQKLDQEYKEDGDDGLILLALSLTAATLTREQYRAAGVSDEIFLATMACFPRFLEEDYKSAGRVCFTRAFWVWRQLSARIFRIGELEFEYRSSRNMDEKLVELTGDRFILSVHIPSDAVMSDENLTQSYQGAVDFFSLYASQFCPEGQPVAFFCSTWLLSPELARILPASSRILRFARDYKLYNVNPDSDSFYFWLFNDEKELDSLPQQTSLQRLVVSHLKQGGKIGTASGLMELPETKLT